MEPDGDIRSDGLIIIGKCNDNVLKKLSAKYKSIVSVNRNSTNYLVDEVICDGKRIAALAVEYLIGLGHRKIGYVGTVIMNRVTKVIRILCFIMGSIWISVM
mgnify:CR=1 FL=1